MSISVSAIVLKTNRLEEAFQFYSALGIQLEKDQQEAGGPAHYSSEINGVHFGIYELDPWTKDERRARGQETMIGFEVDNLDQVIIKMNDLSIEVVIPPEEVAWGKRAVVVDPDGRPTELNQKPTS